MRKGTRIGLIAGGVVFLIGMIFLCSFMVSGNKGAPAPMSTIDAETEDCDAEDRRNKEVEDCGIGVLLDPGKKSTAPAVKPPVSKCTKIPARKC